MLASCKGVCFILFGNLSFISSGKIIIILPSWMSLPFHFSFLCIRVESSSLLHSQLPFLISVIHYASGISFASWSLLRDITKNWRRIGGIQTWPTGHRARTLPLDHNAPTIFFFWRKANFYKKYFGSSLIYFTLI